MCALSFGVRCTLNHPLKLNTVMREPDDNWPS